MRESQTLREIMAAIGYGVGRVFRNNVGEAWQGKWRRLPNGDVLIENARRVKYGLCVGSSDLIGWRSIEITPDMVGRRVAVFSATEAKSDLGGLTAEQDAFLNAVRAAGGIGIVARSADEAVEGVEKYFPPTC